MSKTFKHTLSNGLKLIFVKREGFIKSYCGIGCKYGGANKRYILNDEEIDSPYGIAHFIEHKLFLMPDGTDAFMTFNKQNAMSNAYTASDKTLYYFTKNSDIKDSLKLLLEMYFTPVFTPESVESEKSIIKSEIEMYEDNVGARITQRNLDALYPNDPYSYMIAGRCSDIDEITADDLNNAYHAFYTPQNSVLCIVGDYDFEDLVAYIEDILSGLVFSMAKATKLKTIESKGPIKPYEYTEQVYQSEATIMLRLDDITNQDPIACEKILGVLESLLSVSAEFSKSLEKKGLYENDIDYQVVTAYDTSYAQIIAPSKKPHEFAKAIIKKLNNLTEADLNELIIDLYIKHLKSRSILKEDSIEGIGENILSLALEDIDYEDGLKAIINLKANDLNDVLESIKTCPKTYTVVKCEE